MVVGGDFVAVEADAPAVGCGDAVDDPDEGGLAGAVGAEQSVDRSAGNGDRDVVERLVSGVLLRDVFSRKDFHGCLIVCFRVKPSANIKNKAGNFKENLSFFDKNTPSSPPGMPIAGLVPFRFMRLFCRADCRGSLLRDSPAAAAPVRIPLRECGFCRTFTIFGA